MTQVFLSFSTKMRRGERKAECCHHLFFHTLSFSNNREKEEEESGTKREGKRPPVAGGGWVGEREADNFLSISSFLFPPLFAFFLFFFAHLFLLPLLLLLLLLSPSSSYFSSSCFPPFPSPSFSPDLRCVQHYCNDCGCGEKSGGKWSPNDVFQRFLFMRKTKNKFAPFAYYIKNYYTSMRKRAQSSFFLE